MRCGEETMRIASITFIVAAIALASINVQSQAVSSLIGVWKVAEIVSPDGQKQANPQPTIYIFTARHYSHVSVTSPQPRPNYTGPTVTDAQRLEMWQPFSATSGTYAVGAKQFTIRPMVAKNPGFMTPGSFTTFEWTMDGKDVWIRAMSSDAGQVAAAVANRVRLIRLE
jgi:hypothetical protein